jgi:hypothetical protein
MGTDHEILMQVKERQDVLARQIQEARDLKTQPPAVSGIHQVMMAPPGQDERSAHKAEKVAIGLACLLIGLLFGGWSMVSDLKDDVSDLKRQQQRTDDYLNMLWRTYPETREAALKAQEDRKNGKPNRN